MKGPSLEAIRKFKQQQEEKKRQEDEKKVQEKLSTLGHRALQGDKKAKSQLKKIEKVQEERSRKSDQNKNLDHRDTNDPKTSRDRPGGGCLASSSSRAKDKSSIRKPKNVIETDFEELMRLARNNTNEIRRPTEAKPKERSIKRILTRDTSNELSRLASTNAIDKKEPPVYNKLSRAGASVSKPINKPAPESRSDLSMNIPQKAPFQRQLPGGSSMRYPREARPKLPPTHHQLAVQQYRQRPQSPHYRQQMRRTYYHDDHDDYDDEDEDEYESDGFVVNEDDDEVQDELSKTLKSVFHYDKRRCDLREQELDRQYRAIGRVNTFEDLEREERRASRLAAIEDATAQRDEEERKRLKKIRLSGRD